MNQTLKWNVNWIFITAGLYAISRYLNVFEKLGVSQFVGVILLGLFVLFSLIISAVLRSASMLNLLASGHITEYLREVEKALGDMDEDKDQPLSSSKKTIDERIISFTLQKIEGLFYLGEHERAIALLERLPHDTLSKKEVYVEGLPVPVNQSAIYEHYLRLSLLLLSHHQPAHAEAFFELHKHELETLLGSASGGEFELHFALAVYQLLVKNDLGTKAFFSQLKNEAKAEIYQSAAAFYLRHIALAEGRVKQAESYFEIGKEQAPELFYWR